MTRPAITKELFEVEYFNNHKTFQQIADETGHSPGWLYKKFKKFGLVARPRKMPNAEITEDDLRRLYHDEMMSQHDIALHYGYVNSGPISLAMKRFGIDIRPMGWISPARVELRQRYYRGFNLISGRQWGKIRSNAAIRHISFEITIEDAWDVWVEQSGMCALSGVPLFMPDVRVEPIHLGIQTASLDRIDSALSYTKDNIQWIHKELQRMKMDMNEDAFLAWCGKIAGYKGLNSLS